jgi:hypothetical protein
MLIDELRKPDAIEVRCVGSEIQRHRMKRSLLSISPMQVLCHGGPIAPASLDVPRTLLQSVIMLQDRAEYLAQCS